MATDPLISVLASIRLKTAVIPTVQVVDDNGTLAQALAVTEIAEYPTSAGILGDVTSGSPIIYGIPGTNTESIAPGSVGSGTGFSSVSVTSIVSGSAKSFCRASTAAADPKSSLYLHPSASLSNIVQFQKVVSSSFPSGVKVVATAAQPFITNMAITTTNASATVTVADSSGLYVGMYVTAPTIPAGRFITAIPTGTTFTLNSGTSVTAGTATNAVLTLAVSSMVETTITTTSGSATVTCPDTSVLTVGQIIEATAFPGGAIYVSAIGSSTTFTASTTASSTTVDDNARFGAIICLSAAATATATGLTATFGAVITMASDSSSTASSATITFTGNGRTMDDVQDGNYCVVSIPMNQVVGTGNTGFYLTAYGYVRYFSPGMRQFYLWDAAVGGNPITALTAPDDANYLLYAPGSSFSVAIFKTSDLTWPLHGYNLRGRLTADPDLARGAEPMRLVPTWLAGRVTASYLQDVASSSYLHFARAGLSGRLASDPDIDSIEQDIELAETFLTSRLTAVPELIGGYLRMTAETIRGRFYHSTIYMLSNAEDFTPADATLTGTTTGLLSGTEYLRRTTPIRALLRGNGNVFMISTNALNVRDAVASIGQLWYQLNLDIMPTDVREKALEILNSAFQLIYSRARHLDYFNKASVNVTVSADEDSVVLPGNIQTVLGNVLLADTKSPLWSATSPQEVANMPTLYGMDATGTPQFFYIDSIRQAEADVVRSTLYVAPTPTEDTDITLDVAIEAPRYTWDDVTLGTPLQLPHTYSESLLLPIARFQATSFRLFLDPNQLPQIKEQFARAQRQLGLVAPDPKASAKPQTANVEGTE